MTDIQRFKQTNIGMIPEAWTVSVLSDVIKILGGGTPHTTNKEYWNGDIPWISVSDFVDNNRWIYNTEKTITKKGLDESSTRLLFEGNLIISARGTVGKIAQISKEMAFNQTCYGLIGSETITNDFLYYLLRNNIKKLKSQTHGSVFSTITRNTFEHIYVSLPPIQEQKSITKILSALDIKIELNQKMNQILENMAQTVFKSWFVDFEFPGEDGRPYRSSGGKMAYSKELGKEKPKGWAVKPIADICNTYGGGTPSTKNPTFWGGDINWVVPSDLTKSNYLFLKNTGKKITESGLANCSSKLHPKNSIFMTSRASIGYFAINTMPCAANQGFIIIEPKNELDLFYLYCNFKYRVNEFIQSANGTTFLEIGRSIFRKLPIMMPPEFLVESFYKFVCPIYSQIKNYENASQVLTKLRDELLPKLISGKLNVTSDSK